MRSKSPDESDLTLITPKGVGTKSFKTFKAGRFAQGSKIITIAKTAGKKQYNQQLNGLKLPGLAPYDMTIQRSLTRRTLL